jgi:hypothetical protein
MEVADHQRGFSRGIAFLLVGLKYDLTEWRALWPRIMRNAIEGAKRANARLVFFDNVYMLCTGIRTGKWKA